MFYSRIANNECRMNLKPQDLLFLLKLVSKKGAPWTFNELAIELGMSPSEVHAAAKRATMARLAIKDEANTLPNIRNLTEFLLHGVQYTFFPERGSMSRGLPTAHAAPPLIKSVSADSEPPPVFGLMQTGMSVASRLRPCTSRFPSRRERIRNCTNCWHWSMRFAVVERANANWRNS
jgi:hypothetical protein